MLDFFSTKSWLLQAQPFIVGALALLLILGTLIFLPERLKALVLRSPLHVAKWLWRHNTKIYLGVGLLVVGAARPTHSSRNI